MRYSKKKKRPSGYRSGFEEKVAAQLDAAKVPFKYEQDTFKYNLPTKGFCKQCFGTKVAVVKEYTPDFKIKEGLYIESKGKFTSKDRTKMAAMKEQHLDLDIRLLFMADNTLNKGSTTRYSEWATKLGYRWALRTIPPQWIKEFKKNV